MDVILFCLTATIICSNVLKSECGLMVREADDESTLYDTLEEPSMRTRANGKRRKTRGLGASYWWRKWYNNTVPTIIPDEYKPKEKKILLKSIANWEKATCVKFKMVKSFVGPHLRFVRNKPRCYSGVGMKDRKRGQIIAMSPACLGDGTVTHELGHTLGMYHEQDRPDRDLYINVIEENIRKSKLRNFRKKNWVESQTMGIPYDFESLMHYRKFQFVNSAKPGIVPHDQSMHDTIGNKKKLTFFDIKFINLVYCSDICKGGINWDKCKNGGYRDPLNCSSCRCPFGLTGQFCTDVADGINGDCGDKFRIAKDDWTTLVSPGYPKKRPKSYSACNWLIKTEPGKRIELILQKMEIDCWNKFACDGTYVSIHYTTNISLPAAKLCCYKPTETIKSHGTQMLILFRIGEYMAVNKGVQMIYKAVNCGGCRGVTEPACLKTLEEPCFGEYQDKCAKPTKTKTKCTYYRENYCLKTIMTCCKTYILNGSSCIAPPPPPPEKKLPEKKLPEKKRPEKKRPEKKRPEKHPAVTTAQPDTTSSAKPDVTSRRMNESSSTEVEVVESTISRVRPNTWGIATVLVVAYLSW